jgi:hypothetical protein
MPLIRNGRTPADSNRKGLIERASKEDHSSISSDRANDQAKQRAERSSKQPQRASSHPGHRQEKFKPIFARVFFVLQTSDDGREHVVDEHGHEATQKANTDAPDKVVHARRVEK